MHKSFEIPLSMCERYVSSKELNINCYERIRVHPIDEIVFGIETYKSSKKCDLCITMKNGFNDLS